MRNRWVAAGAATVTLGAAALASALPASAATGHPSAGSSGRVQLRNSTPVWAHGRASGAQSAAAPVNVQVYLAPQGGDAALDAAVAAVSDPASSSYHQFLTPAQYRARFGPTNAEVAAVSNWLGSAGLIVDGVEASHRYVSAHGSAAAAQAAFGVRLNRYQRGNQSVQAADRDLSVPDSVAPYVEGVTGLDTAPVALAPAFPPPPAFQNARPCSTFYGQVIAKYQADFKTPLPPFQGTHPPYAVCGYTPPQLEVAYGAASTGLTGSGFTVGIVDAYASSTILSDANTYAGRNGTSTFGPGQYSQTLPSSFALHSKVCQTPGDWAGEQTLDVEAAHALAPNANVHYYGARSCLDPDLRAAVARAVDDNQVSTLSNSYGDAGEQGQTAGSVRAWEQVYKQAAMQGISVLYSSGDSGDEVANTGIRQADYPASDPFVTAVGGTSTAIGPDGKILWQTGWGTHKFSLSTNGKSWTPLGFLYGAGGGFSRLFNRPSYQDGVVPAASAGRAVPDVALDADPTTGMLIGITQAFPNGNHYGEYRIGGTSLASPLMAGMVALASQHAGSRLGFLNIPIYQLAKSGSSAFDDVTANHTGQGNVRADYANGVDASQGILYSVRTFNQDSSLTTGKGWDDVTGVGVPNAGFLQAFSK